MHDLSVKLIELMELARELADDAAETDPALFVERVGPYLEKFEEWQQAHRLYVGDADTERSETGVRGSSDQLTEAERGELRAKIAALAEVHLKVLQYANDHKDRVGEKMSHVHRRAYGLKAYVDRFPSRITIAGKRKG